MIASAPRISARGMLRRGSFTSPLMKLRSAHPSYAHSTETSASPNAEIEKLPAGAAGVKWPPVRGKPNVMATITISSRPTYFAIVVMFCTHELKRTPIIFTPPMAMIAMAAT